MDDNFTAKQSKTAQTDAALDTTKLLDFLRTHLDDTIDSTNFSVERFTQGYSNLTYLLHVGSQDLVLRRPPIGANIKSGHDMAREYRLLTSLHPIYPKVPRAILYSDDTTILLLQYPATDRKNEENLTPPQADPDMRHVNKTMPPLSSGSALGAPFYIMERVQGIILRKEPPANITLNPPIMERLSQAFIENLATIHSLDYATTDLKNMARPGSYVERQITGWLDRYARAKTDDLPAIERVGNWLAEHHLPDSGSSLIHNDYKYDNMILDPSDLSRIVAVLDWEMATIGDPLMDLGTTLAYWVQPDDPAELQTARMGITNLPGNLDRAQLAHQYALYSGREVRDIVFYYVYGLFKIAVIAQQIYARYKKGVASDVRFAQLPLLVQAIGITASQAIEKNRIDQLTT